MHVTESVPGETDPEWVSVHLAPTVAATYWFDPGERGKLYTARIRFHGRRLRIDRKPEPGDRFEQVETVEGVVPGSGPIAVTTRAFGLNPGDWLVTAEPVVVRSPRRGPASARLRSARKPPFRGPKPSLPRTLLSWGTPLMSPGLPGHVQTRPKPFASSPGSILGTWPALIALGVLVGLAVQVTLIRRSHVSLLAAFELSVTALLAGAVGAKVWFLVVKREVSTVTMTDGLCIQGFIAGVALLLTSGLVLLHLPIGTFLDSTAPGLFLGMAIGRPGCFLTGCCAGRMTASRWGVWASDRRVGARRFPVQLWEALLCLTIGVATLTLATRPLVNVPGAIALGGLAAYTLGRQLLFTFRAESRRSSIGRPSALATAAAVLVADAVCWAITCL